MTDAAVKMKKSALGGAHALKLSDVHFNCTVKPHGVGHNGATGGVCPQGGMRGSCGTVEQTSAEACAPKKVPEASKSKHDSVVSTLNNMQAKVAGCVVGIINGKFGVRNMAKQANILLPGEVEVLSSQVRILPSYSVGSIFA